MFAAINFMFCGKRRGPSKSSEIGSRCAGRLRCSQVAEGCVTHCATVPLFPPPPVLLTAGLRGRAGVGGVCRTGHAPHAAISPKYGPKQGPIIKKGPRLFRGPSLCQADILEGSRRLWVHIDIPAHEVCFVGLGCTAAGVGRDRVRFDMAIDEQEVGRRIGYHSQPCGCPPLVAMTLAWTEMSMLLASLLKPGLIGWPSSEVTVPLRVTVPESNQSGE